MPFKKLGPDKYEGPSGKVFDKKQVRLAYATDNFTKAPGKSKTVHKSAMGKRSK